MLSIGAGAGDERVDHGDKSEGLGDKHVEVEAHNLSELINVHIQANSEVNRRNQPCLIWKHKQQI